MYRSLQDVRCPFCGQVLGRGVGEIEHFEIKCRRCKALVMIEHSMATSSLAVIGSY